jgi:CheY-like chemotaxis protein
MARILLINDEPDLLEMCELVLEGAGHTAIRAFGDTQALELVHAANSRPDVVLLDLVMPRVSGEEVFRRLRRAPETEHVPIVVMSALPDAEEIAEEMGAESFLEKPFDPEALLTAVERALTKGRNGGGPLRGRSPAALE